jgi:peptidoglycan/LPS O-acetylase OafA/YrhL
MTNAKPKSLLTNVQALRAIAALLVVCFHADKLFAYLHIPPFGLGGVDIFFVVSGFIMVHTTMDRKTTPWEFMRHRISRIVPIYWVATLAVFAVAVIAPAAVKTTTSGSVALIKSLLFIPFAKSGTSTFRPDLFVGWTLNYEMFFYVLFAIGLAYPRYVVGVRWVCVALGGLVIAGLLANPQGTNLLLFYSDSIVIEFALGMLIGLYLPRVTVSPSRLNKGLLVSLLVASLACVVVIPTIASGNIPRLFTMGVPATGVVGSALLLEQCGLVMTNPLVLLLGGASYSLYLTHSFITEASVKLGNVVHLKAWSAAILIVATLALACFVAWVVSQTIELPLSRRARKWLDHPRGIGSTAGRAPVPHLRPAAVEAIKMHGTDDD